MVSLLFATRAEQKWSVSQHPTLLCETILFASIYIVHIEVKMCLSLSGAELFVQTKKYQRRTECNFVEGQRALSK